MVRNPGENKVRTLKVYEIMRRTDEKHPLNNTQICNLLKKKYNIVSDRKAVGRDLKCLDLAGYTIKRSPNHNDGTYMVDQLYEDYELKIMADAVCCARFLTAGDTEQLLRKIKRMATDEGESIIEDTAFYDKNLKSVNYKNKSKIDTLIRAIREKKTVRFKYFEIGEDLKLRHKREGHEYNVSPYFLALYNNEYFLVANSQSSNSAIHFRVEMIDGLEMTDTPARDIQEIESFYDEDGQRIKAEEYLKNAVGMWSGSSGWVTLECKNEALQEIQNTFGQDVQVFGRKKESFKARVKVVAGQGFYHWLAGKGTDIKITAPAKVREAYRQYLKAIADMYDEE